MKIFKNNNNQLRSGWKVSLVIIGSIIFFIGFYILLLNMYEIFTGSDFETFEKNPFMELINQVLDTLALLLILFIAFRTFDKKSFKDIGVSAKNHLKELVLGLLLGAGSITLIFFILYLSNNIELENSFTTPNFSIHTLTGLGLFILVGFKEELLSRGYCITAFNQMGKPWLSAVISSLIFSLLHVANPNVKLLGLLNVFLVGLLFSYMFIKTKNLMMPIGYHITWNYFQGNVFGFPVSGIDIHGIYGVTILKDNLLTGGSFGPEAGILTTMVIVLGMLLVWKTYGKTDFLTRNHN